MSISILSNAFANTLATTVSRIPLPVPKPSRRPRQASALSSKQRKSQRFAVLHRASQATPSLPPALPGSLRWQCAGLLQRAIAAVTCPQPAAPHLRRHSPEAPISPPLQTAQSSGKRLPSPSPETLSQRLCLESLSLSSQAPEAPIPPPESLREATPQSSPNSLLMVPASPQRDALPRAPTTLSNLYFLTAMGFFD